MKVYTVTIVCYVYPKDAHMLSIANNAIGQKTIIAHNKEDAAREYQRRIGKEGFVLQEESFEKLVKSINKNEIAKNISVITTFYTNRCIDRRIGTVVKFREN